MTGAEELRAVAAVALAVALPIAFVLLAIWNTTREATEEETGQAGAARALAGRLLAWASGLTLASTAVLLLLA